MRKSCREEERAAPEGRACHCRLLVAVTLGHTLCTVQVGVQVLCGAPDACLHCSCPRVPEGLLCLEVRSSQRTWSGAEHFLNAGVRGPGCLLTGAWSPRRPWSPCLSEVPLEAVELRTLGSQQAPPGFSVPLKLQALTQEPPLMVVPRSPAGCKASPQEGCCFCVPRAWRAVLAVVEGAAASTVTGPPSLLSLFLMTARPHALAPNVAYGYTAWAPRAALLTRAGTDTVTSRVPWVGCG